jgi:tetratricopeptide (TPR) repeat protein
MFKSSIILLFSILLSVSCARDPNKRKISYLNSGDEYLSAHKYQEAVIQFRNAIQVDPKFAAAHNQLAQAYLALGNSEAAFRELNTTIDLDPQNPQARLSLATLQIARRQYSEAQLTLQQVLKRDPTNAQAHALLSQKNLAVNDLPRAITELQKVVELEPGRTANYAALGAVQMAAGHSSEAEPAYRKATEINPKSVDAHVALGEFYFSQRKLTQAEAEIRIACDLDGKAVIPRIFLGRTLVAEGRLADAERSYATLKAIAPDDPKAYPALALFYSETGQKDKALAELQALATAKPKDDAVKVSLIETLIDLNRIAEAEPMVRAALKGADQDKGANPKILLSYGRILIAEGKYSDAAAPLQKVLAAEPKSADAHYYLGIVQKAIGQPGLAKTSFGQALALSPRMSRASAALSNLDVRSGSRDEALKEADQAIRGNPAVAQGYVVRARALIAKGDTVQGAAAIEDALHRDPLNLPALGSLLNLAISQGKTANAVQRITTLSEQNPRNAGLHFLLAMGHFSLKDLNRSEAHLNQAMTLDASTPQAWTLMANIDFARGRTEKGKADLRHAMALSPQTISNYTALGTQFEKEKNWEEAKRMFEKAHDLDRSSPFVAAELTFLYLEHGGDVNVALSLAQTAKQALPNSPITADALGWAYYKLGSTDQAIEELKTSVQMIPANPVYHYHLGMAYASARRWDKAALSLRTALQDDPAFPYAASAKATLDQIGQQPKSAR